MNKIKVCIIPDLHGRDVWKEVRPKRYDKIILLGDYCDSFDIGNVEILHNLKEIIEFKKEYPNKVELLLGNHDLPYAFLHDSLVPMCEGHRAEMAYDLHFLFKENKDLFKIAYQLGNHLFTHAGISKAWYDEHQEVIKDFWEQLSDIDDKVGVTIADVLNSMAETRHKAILFQNGEARGGRKNSNGGPLWACYEETKKGVLESYKHVCGHTALSKIETIRFNANTSITYTDILHTKEKFYELEIVA